MPGEDKWVGQASEEPRGYLTRGLLSTKDIRKGGIRLADLRENAGRRQDSH